MSAPFCDDELIIDLFAGGGGVSTGIEMALGRSPDYAINHSGPALAMHAANHPDTHHLQNDIWGVDPNDIAPGRPVGLLWLSPDCKHFSRAKGGPLKERNIRDLAWVGIDWAEKRRPKVIVLENVAEFLTWGPLYDDGSAIAQLAGQTFEDWVSRLKGLGYRVEWKLRVACDYGDPTIRKRLILIARCDGGKIIWPAPTHGKPQSPAVLRGKVAPWRTAGEVIDWSIPCPSIFDTAEEIKAKHGLRAVRPLAENTLRRIAAGVKRYVLEAKEPYFVTLGQHGGKSRSGKDPLHTITASPKDQNALVVPYLAPRYQEKPGQEPRTRPVDEPSATIVSGGHAPGAIVAPQLVRASYIQRDFGTGVGHGCDAPMNTVTAGGGGHATLVSAFMAQHNSGVVGRPLDAPISTVTATGAQQALVAAHMMSLKGTQRRDSAMDAPLPALCAGGGHAAMVAALLVKYYGAGIGAGLDEPLHTVTARDRFGLVTVSIDGESFVIVDIGMRMLTARELFNAQGFPPDYIIDPLYQGRPLTKGQQTSCVGNSVPPGLVAAHIAANCGWLTRRRDAA